MGFLVIPAVDLKDGKCVRLVQGDPMRRTVELEDPVMVAKIWEEKGAGRLHLVDLDGALGGARRNEDLVKKIISSLSIPVQFGGGLRSFEEASRILDFGAEKIIIGTAALERRELLESLKEKYGKERLIVALDSKGGQVVTKGWVKKTGVSAVDAVKGFEDLVSECLFTNVDVEGLVKGMNAEVIKKMVDATKIGIIASGGVSSIKDIEKIKKTGAIGVVIGTALYKGNIDFEKALELEED